MLGTLLGMGASAGMGFLSNWLNGMMNTGFQKELQEHAAATNYKYAEKSAKNTPTWNRAGLESAGYNPMLAVQNATGGANSSWTSTGQAGTGDEDISSSIANAQSFQRLKNETKTAETTASMNDATARNQNAEAANKELQNKYITKRQEAELGKIEAETANINRATEHYEAIEHNMEVMQRLQEMGINLNYSSSIYGANKAYNASTYSANKAYEASKFASDVNERNNIRSNRIQRGKIGILGSGFYSQSWADKWH